MTSPILLWPVAPVSAALALSLSLYYYRYCLRQGHGSAAVNHVSHVIREGANAFLRREYRVLLYFVSAASVLLLLFAPSPIWSSPTPWRNLAMAVAYALGSFGSGAAGLLGMRVATRTNARTVAAAQIGISRAFTVAFRGGAVMGLSVVSIGLLGVSLTFAVTHDAEILVGYALGASSIALFAKAGGGIFTKTADIAADLVGKVELGLAEDDPRNPAVIADNVGDNVGDVAGMGADLLDSYVASLVAVIVLGSALDTGGGTGHAQMALVYASAGVLASMVGTMLVRISDNRNAGRALNKGTHLGGLLFAALSAGATVMLHYQWRVWAAMMLGLLVGALIGATTDYFTADGASAVRKTAEAAQSGAAINIVTGFSYGLQTVLPALFGIAAAVVAAYHLCLPLGGAQWGVFGVSMAALGMLSLVGLTVTNDAYGPIVDNARGIAEQAGLSEEVLRVTDKLDTAGNAAKAITKGFAIGAAGLTVLSLLAAFAAVGNKALSKLQPDGVPSALAHIDLSILNPLVLAGMLVGVSLPALFSAQVMMGVMRNTRRLVDEIRRQFREIPGLRAGEPGVKPDSARCVDIATEGALRELLPASLVAVGATVAVGFLGGLESMAGCLAGAILSSLLLGLLMSNAGGVWDNAKKLIESGEFGGRGSDAHKAAVVGDTVGDPFKDTAGPSLNTLLTVMSLVATLMAGWIAKYNLAHFLWG